MPSNLIRLKQINQSELSGFIIDAVESTELYNQIASGTAYFDSGIYYFRVLPKIVESNKSFSIGSDNLISGDTTNNIFGGSFNLIGTGLTNSVIIGGQNNTLAQNGNTNSIIMSDLSYIDVNGFNNGILFGNGNYITGQSGDGNVIIGGLYNLIGPSPDSNNLILNGQNNVLLGTQSFIIGGYYNYSSGSNQAIMTDFGSAVGDYASLIGGRENVIQGGKHNSIINGYNNYILRPFTYTGDFTGSNSIIGSWKSNILPDSRFALVLGGAYQNISGFATILIGGYQNRLSGNYSALVGGFSNIVSGAASTIQGGAYNSVYGNYSTIIGGRDNLVSGAGDSFSIGRNNQLFASGAGFISDGSNRVKIITGSAFDNSLNIDFLNGVNVKSKLSVNGSGVILNGETITVTLPPTVVYTTGDQTISGNKTFAGQVNLNSINDLNLSGVNVSITNGNVIVTNPLSAPNLVYNTGNQTISGVKTFLNSGVFSLSGASALNVPNNPLSIVGSGNTYLQLNIQNRATGTDASADLVITANNGTDSTNYINLGINNSGYSNSAFTNGTGYDGYLFIDGGNLDIGTRTPGRIIEFHAGGTTQEKTIARISESGLNIVSGNLTVNNTGVLLSGQNSFILTLAHASDSNLNLGHNFFGNMFGAGTASLNSRKFNVLETCAARKFTWTNYVGTLGSAPGINATGYFINATKQITGTLTTALTNNSANTQQVVYGAISPPIAISDGDEVAASIGYISGGVGTLPTAVRNNVNIYCYN